MNFYNMIKIRKNKRVRGIPSLRKPDMVLGKNYQIGKMGKTSFKRKNYHSEEVLELVHPNLCEPIGIESYGGDNYFILFVDDYSRTMIIIYLNKSEAFQKFKQYIERLEKEIGKKLKCLRLERGGEFISNGFFTKRGIKRPVLTLGTPEQNDIAERRNRSIMDCARALMI